MRKLLKNQLLILLGWFFVLLGLIGVVLPILPTTPFLILALALFSESSPRFHQMLLHNPWFGAALRQWDEQKTLSRRIKHRATALIVVSFSVSIWILNGKLYLQILLVFIAVTLLLFLWKIKE